MLIVEKTRKAIIKRKLTGVCVKSGSTKNYLITIVADTIE